jgi:hypothetical protein
MSLKVFDTQFGAQGIENIGEIWYFMVPFLTQRGASCVLVLVASNMEVLLFNGIPKGIPCGGDRKYCRFLYGPFLRVSITPFLNMGDGLEEGKINLLPVEKIMDRKIPFEQIQPFIYSICILISHSFK